MRDRRINMRITRPLLAAALAAAGVAFAGIALADDVTVVGPVTRIQLAPDGKSAVAMLKDGNSGEEVAVRITDELTLDKLKDKRIVEGDEIRARFEKKEGNNTSKTFKKTAGC
jgi:hypothetical protein